MLIRAFDPADDVTALTGLLPQAALAYAGAQGARFMGLDTAAPARDLIALYERWGYRIIGRIRFDATNYESVIMRRRL